MNQRTMLFRKFLNYIEHCDSELIGIKIKNASRFITDLISKNVDTLHFNP